MGMENRETGVAPGGCARAGWERSFGGYAARKSRERSDIFRRMAVRVDKTAMGGSRLSDLRCNLKCRFCHEDSFMKRTGRFAVDNQFLVETLKRLHGIANKPVEAHISGRGEPTLCGAELCELIREMKKLDFVTAIKLTTNGLLLGKLAADLALSGLSSVNVSLHSMRRERYAEITGVDALGGVLEGIDCCVEAGLPAKINCTAGPGLGRELDSYLDLSRRKKIPIKIFHILKEGGEEGDAESEKALSEIEGELEKKAQSRKEYQYPYNGKVLYVDGAVVDLKDSRVNACPKEKCAKRRKCLEGCRYSIRLTSDGYLQPCPVRTDNAINLKDPGLNASMILAALESGGKYAFSPS